MKKALSIFCFFIIAFVNIFAIDGNAYAFDGEYVDKFGKWYNKGTVIDIDCSFVQGQFHYIMDEKNGCAYFYFAYTDFLDEYSEDDVQLEFYVYNSINNYTFSVTNSGISDDSVLKNLDIYINFSNINADSHNGRLLVGFELKNKSDKKLTNFISCTFKVSSTKSCNLVDECKLDMYVEPTTTAKKVTTTKLTTSKLKEKRTVVPTVSSKTTNKTNKTKGQVSTKFVPKQKLTQSQINGSETKKAGRKSGKKFSGSASNSVRTTKFEYSTATATTAPKEKAVTTSTDYTSYPKAVYSKKSKNIFIFGGVLGTIGLVLLLYGVISHSNTKEDDEKIDKL